MSHRVPIITAALLAVAALAACGGEGGAATAGSGSAASNRGLPQGSEPVTLDPTDFTTRIDNPYFPLRPGSRWVYRETDTTGHDSASSSP